MTSYSIAHDGVTASLYAGWVAAIAHDPRRWQFPESTASYLQWRVVDLAAALIVHDAGTGVAV